MSWNYTLGLIALLSLCLPILAMIFLRLATYRTFPALFAGLTLTFIYNLLNLGFIKVPKVAITHLNFWNNILDAPLMLLFLTYLSFSPKSARKIMAGIIVYFVFELTMILVFGISTKTLTIIVGPGLAAVFAICLVCFIRHTKITIMHRKASGKAIISAALLFAYGSYFLIYLMYYVVKTPYVADTYLVYYLSVTFSSLMLAAGIFIERKRVQKLNEVIVARRELTSLYSNQARSNAFRPVMLDLDKDHLN